jgi:hypothetical protein
MRSVSPASDGGGAPRATLAFAATILTGAFLLFLVQPLMAKFILPWYGGSPAVWTTCMLFFQSALLAGYGYAHLLTRMFRPRVQVMVHLLLVVAALAVLPITPADSWKPVPGADPVGSILLLLSACLGLPYLLLAATSPLLQRWYASIAPGRVPYRFFALSNAGSFLALLAYPFVLEPLIGRSAQATAWSFGLGLYVAALGLCAFAVFRRGADAPAALAAAPVARVERTFWLLLPATASVLLLAVTNKLCQDIAVVPFLWVLPLLIYLASFVLCFDRPRWYSRTLFAGLFIAGAGAVSFIPFWGSDPPVALTLWGHCLLLFSACVLCHGELYRRRPSPEGLTGYYLTIAAGGALGGFFVVLVAPALFSDYAELPIATVGCAAAVLAILYREKGGLLSKGRRPAGWAIALLLVAGYIGAYGFARSRERMFTIENTRNFYGTLKVAEYDSDRPTAVHRTMRHGAILHGLQYLSPRYQSLPTAYYTEHSGVGYCLQFYPKKDHRKVGVVGLGVGTLAAWGAEGDTVRFYEINPTVTALASRHFTYLRKSKAVVTVVEGDARLSLEHEVPQMFDVLILDAFNSDSPPVHLLTREAFAIYRRHLKPGGAIAVNMTCKYLNFFPVVSRLAVESGYRWAYIHDANAEDAFYRSSSTWLVMSTNEGLMENEGFRKVGSQPRVNSASFPLWTDDYSPLARILAW